MISSFNYLLALGGAAFAPETGAGSKAPTSTILKFGNLELDTKRRVLRIYQVTNGEIRYDRHAAEVKFTKARFEILEYLFKQDDKAATRAELIANSTVRKSSCENTINTHISYLRKAIRNAPYCFDIFETPRGKGIHLVAETLTDSERQKLLKRGIVLGEFTLIKSRSELYYGNEKKPINLGPDLLALLVTLFKNPGKALHFKNKDISVIRTEIKKLRGKLEELTGTKAHWIETVIGKGYCFRPDAAIRTTGTEAAGIVAQHD